MHDGITFERLGIPAAVVITAPFIPTAEAISELDGMPDYGFVTIPHPVTSLSVEQLAERARDAAAQVEALLLGTAGGAQAAGAADGHLARADVETVLQPYRTGLQTDGADLLVDSVDDDGVALRLTFSDATCMDCVMPPPTVRSVLTSLLSTHYGRDVTVFLDDPRETGTGPVATTDTSTTEPTAGASADRRGAQ